MIFNSPQFIFFFVPFVFCGYFILNSVATVHISRAWLAACSLFFYSYWNPRYLPLILLSIGINFLIGKFLIKSKPKLLLIVGIVFNLSLLGYYKYFDFFITNVNHVFSSKIPLLHLILPLAISFFTFQQISYLVDCYKAKAENYNFINYALFITFFPHLVAGPIVHHRVMMPQFQSTSNLKINHQNVAMGIYIFSIGLFKKVILADSFSPIVSDGLNYLNTMTFFDAWAVILSYAFQLYFDFSGYSDMAIGLALLFNIKLPINFDSPYKSTNFQQVVARWHITLTRFLYEYVYSPMNKFLSRRLYSTFKLSVGTRTAINLLLLFLLSGIWHGAGWNFILWGGLMGGGVVIYRSWSNFNIKLPTVIAWAITFCYLNLVLVFFRESDLHQAVLWIKAMLGFNGFILPEQLAHFLSPLSGIGLRFESTPLQNKARTLGLIAVGFVLILGFKNSSEKMNNFKPTFRSILFIVAILAYSILNLTRASEFLYFKF
jgi:alginate O-acetyltransferase complex protein AlgI